MRLTKVKHFPGDLWQPADTPPRNHSTNQTGHVRGTSTKNFIGASRLKGNNNKSKRLVMAEGELRALPMVHKPHAAPHPSTLLSRFAPTQQTTKPVVRKHSLQMKYLNKKRNHGLTFNQRGGRKKKGSGRGTEKSEKTQYAAEYVLMT